MSASRREPVGRITPLPTEPHAAPDGRQSGIVPSFIGDPAALQAMLAALVESSDDAIVAKDLDGVIQAWNAGATRIFGYREDEVVGRPITIIIPSERRHEEDAILAAIRRGERIHHFETERVRKDGTMVPVSLSISAIRDDAGRTLGIAKIARDVSAAREARAVQATLAAIVESSDDAIVGKALDGTIMTWNAGAERLFGYAAAEVVGKPITILLPEERLAEETAIVAALRRGERIEHFETERVTKHGTRVAVSLSVSQIKDDQGRIVGAAKIARDITFRRALDQQREALLAREMAARAEAEAASRAKDAFLATLSHELRTPLSPILAWTRMLRQGVLDEAKTARALATIERSARTQTQLIDDLLDVSRIVSGKLRIAIRPTDLASVVHAALEVVRPAAEAKQIHVDVALDPDLGTVAGDAERLQQVVWNLLSNAVKFTPGGGRVTVAAERIGPEVIVTVADTGQGFDAGLRSHLFERFWQEDSSYTRAHGGLGLGLSIVRHIVELHGGTIEAESPGVGHGATFRVRLPQNGARPAVERTADVPREMPLLLTPPTLPRLDGARVVVVDDERDCREVVSTLLASLGAEVRAAAAVAEALETIREWRPHAVLSDIGMPGSDGYALVAELRARERELGVVPAIALTAYASRDDRIRILAAGFRTHVTKPIDPMELAASVASVVRR